MLLVGRLIIVYFWFFGMAAAVMVASLFRPFDTQNALLYTRLTLPLTLKILGVEMILRHQERMKESHPCIYIANHQHALDVPVFGNTLCVDTVSVGKKAVKWIPFFGWLYWLSGQLLIDRGHHGRAMSVMAVAKAAMEERRVSVWMFPEGTRSHGKGLGPFKKGAFRLAIETQRPLLPLVASHYHKFVDLKKWKAGRVIVDVLPPISTLGKTADDMEELIQTARRTIQEGIDRLDQELLLWKQSNANA